MSHTLACPLCQWDNCQPFFHDAQRGYRRCERCQLIYVEPQFHLSTEAEKAQYDLHNNHPEDLAYRRFLGRLCEPLLARLPKARQGLDFGSGPGPTLSVMLEEAGHKVVLYDIYYAPDTAVLVRDYDFITATEVVEHLSRPGLVLSQLWRQLKPGGWLGLMTKLAQGKEAFARWHYKNDPTHIAFFSQYTFIWLAAQWQTEPEFIGNDVILLQKPG